MAAQRSTRFVAGFLALIALLALPVVAAAHGGARVLRTAAGPYQIEANVSEAGSLVDETLAVDEAASGRPVVGATVVLTLEEAGGETAGPFIATPSGGRYEARYPRPRAGRWSVRIEVHGPLGEAETRHDYRAPPGGGIWSGKGALAVNVLVLAVMVAMPFLLPRLGRRSPAATPQS